MLLKRQEENNVIDVIYASSNILTSSFDKVTKALTIIFKNGGRYSYQNVSETDYLRFEVTDSQGKILNTYIKKYPFKKMENVDTTSLLLEIEELKKAKLIIN